VTRLEVKQKLYSLLSASKVKLKSGALDSVTDSVMQDETVLGLLEYLDANNAEHVKLFRRIVKGSRKVRLESIGQRNLHSIISGALFDYSGYLTTLEDPISLGARQEASPAVTHLERWANRRSLSLDSADVSGWRSRLGERTSGDPIAETFVTCFELSKEWDKAWEAENNKHRFQFGFLKSIGVFLRVLTKDVGTQVFFQTQRMGFTANDMAKAIRDYNLRFANFRPMLDWANKKNGKKQKGLLPTKLTK
jgi:hypothetical protein